MLSVELSSIHPVDEIFRSNPRDDKSDEADELEDWSVKSGRGIVPWSRTSGEMWSGLGMVFNALQVHIGEHL